MRDLSYRILVLPNIHALPLESLKRIQQYAHDGGVVIALEQVPGASTGLSSYRERDGQVRAITAEMFRAPQGRDGTGAFQYGKGRTYFIRRVIARRSVLDGRSSAYDPLANTLRQHLPPDFGIDFVREGIRENDGLTFTHRKTPGSDIYFVANVQDRPVDARVAFRVSGRAPQEWNPYNGEIRPLHEYEADGERTLVPVRLAPYQSTLLVFTGSSEQPHVLESNLRKIFRADEKDIEALADHNGGYWAATAPTVRRSIIVDGIPAPFEVAGQWRVVLEGKEFPRVEKTLSRLTSWTEDPATQHFSGTGRYTIEFDLPSTYIADGLRLQLSLGDVGNVAEVELNRTRAGVIWVRGQTLDITRGARPAKNVLVIDVTNTLINRVAGLSTTPPLPPNLAAIYGRGIHDDDPGTRQLYGFHPLPRSGLLGPVLITPLKRVKL